jgi:prevent-host-death family protein
MRSYSVAEAKSKLSALIDEAIESDGVVITRHGRPVVQIKAIAPKPGPVVASDLDWLAKRRETRPTGLNAGDFISNMRDEDER